MRRFGWTGLTCMLLALTVLAALVRLGGAEARSLAARVPNTLTVASKPAQDQAYAPLTEEDLSSLEDMRGEPLPPDRSARPAEPPPPPKPAPVGAARRPAKEKARPAPESGPPVFYRPAGSKAEAGAGRVCGDLRGAPVGGEIVFPLERRFFYSYEDTWGAPRAQGGHEGTDLMTPTGVPEYAVTDGTVVPVEGSDADGWNTLGGHAVMVRADYSIGPVKAGDLFYYAHLEEESPLEVGDRVSAGQVVGHAGDTGQGPPGTSGLFPPHLHLGWYDGTGGREEADSGAMNPYPLLEWIKSNGGAVTGASDARFCEAPRTDPPVPASDAGDWPGSQNPGLSPDLDTGSRDPHPARGANANREENPPANEPARPDRQNKGAAKRPTSDRPKIQNPERPEKDPQRPARPDKDEQTPSKPAPPKPPPSENGPSEPPGSPVPPPASSPAPPPAPPPAPVETPGGHQYDPSTGGPDGTTEASPLESDRGPQATRKPAPEDESPTQKNRRRRHQPAPVTAWGSDPGRPTPHGSVTRQNR